MGTSQSDHFMEIQDFHQWINRARVPGICNSQASFASYFVPKSVLREHFQHPYYAKKLLAALYPDVECRVDPEQILPYSKVFAILLLIGNGKYIQHFVQHDELQDHYLPFEHQPTSFPTATADPDFFKNFCQKQWQFCPPKFNDKMKKHFKADCVLPIVKEERIAEGASAKVYKICLHKEYNYLHREDINSSVIIVS